MCLYACAGRRLPPLLFPCFLSFFDSFVLPFLVTSVSYPYSLLLECFATRYILLPLFICHLHVFNSSPTLHYFLSLLIFPLSRSHPCFPACTLMTAAAPNLVLFPFLTSPFIHSSCSYDLPFTFGYSFLPPLLSVALPSHCLFLPFTFHCRVRLLLLLVYSDPFPQLFFLLVHPFHSFLQLRDPSMRSFFRLDRGLYSVASIICTFLLQLKSSCSSLR